MPDPTDFKDRNSSPDAGYADLRKDGGVAWIVDDDWVYSSFIEGHLKRLGYATKKFKCGEDCLSSLLDSPDIIILDHNLGDGINGLETLQGIRKFNEEIPVVYLSAQNDLTSAVEALKFGAFDYIEKNSSAIIRLKNVIKKIHDFNAVIKQRYTSQIRILTLTAIACFMIILSFMYYIMRG
jgi:DNA-binding NtrC family response regulator